MEKTVGGRAIFTSQGDHGKNIKVSSPVKNPVPTVTERVGHPPPTGGGFKKEINGAGAYQDILSERNKWKDPLAGQDGGVQHRTPLEGQPRTGIVYSGRKV